jgi:hypothetical protein
VRQLLTPDSFKIEATSSKPAIPNPVPWPPEAIPALPLQANMALCYFAKEGNL